MLYVYWFSSSGECGGVPHHNDCSFSLWVSGSVGDVPPQNESPLPACQVRKSVFEHHCFFGFTQSILYFVYQKGNMPLLFRVLVLYLGNLYSLIIALLDKVNSMSSAVSHIYILIYTQAILYFKVILIFDHNFLAELCSPTYSQFLSVKKLFFPKLSSPIFFWCFTQQEIYNVLMN